MLQDSNIDGEHFINTTPCKDLETAKQVMDICVNDLLKEGVYEGLDLDQIEKDQEDDEADCDYYLKRDETNFLLGRVYDDYSEVIRIIEKEIV